MASNLIFPDDQIWTSQDGGNRQDTIKHYTRLSTTDNGLPVIELYPGLPGDSGIRLEVEPEKVTSYIGGKKIHVLDLKSGELSLAFQDKAGIFKTYYDLGKTIKTMLTVNADAVEKLRQSGPKA